MFQRLLLATIALCMLLYLLPADIMRDLTLMVVIAILLIILLFSRARSWFNNESSAFDTALIIGAFVAFVHLFTFSAFDQSGLSVITTLLFSTFFGLLAGLMQEQESFTYARTFNAVPVASQRPRRDHAHDPEFKRGVDPIPERAPPHHVPRLHRRVHAAVRHIFRPKLEPLHEMHPVHSAPAVHDVEFKKGIDLIPEIKPAPAKHDPSFKKGVEPIPEFKAPAPAKKRDANFKRGIEPIPEQVPLKLDVYDTEPKAKKRK